MNILIRGGDGYLGWPTAMHFSALGHDVTVVDNYFRVIRANKPLTHTYIPLTYPKE